MPPYIPADAVQVELTMLFDGQRVQNVFHYETDGVPPTTDMEELGDSIITTWVATMKAWMPTTLSLVEVKVTDLTTQISPVVFATGSLPVQGTNASPALPNNCALVVTKRTLLRGRSFRGRVYVPGLVEGQVTANLVSSAYQANFLSWCTAMRTYATTTKSWVMVIVSKYANNAPRAQAVVTPVTGFSTDGLVDSQRRRLPGRGA